MEDDVAALVSKITFASVATLNLPYCRLLIMVPACARLVVSVASLHLIILSSLKPLSA